MIFIKNTRNFIKIPMLIGFIAYFDNIGRNLKYFFAIFFLTTPKIIMNLFNVNKFERIYRNIGILQPLSELIPLIGFLWLEICHRLWLKELIRLSCKKFPLFFQFDSICCHCMTVCLWIVPKVTKFIIWICQRHFESEWTKWLII